MDIYYYRTLSLWDYPPSVSCPVRYAKNAKPWLFCIQAISQSPVCSEQFWQTQDCLWTKSKLIYLLRTTKAADSPNLVFLNKNTIPLCMQLHLENPWHHCDIWGQGGTNTNILMFMPLFVVQKFPLIFCQQQGNYKR